MGKTEHSEKKNTDIVVFRGSSKLDKLMQEYEIKINESETYIQEACKKELDDLQAAQQRFEEKIKKVTQSKKAKEIEKSMQSIGDDVDICMKKLYRELQQMGNDIEDDITLSDNERRTKLLALNKAAVAQYSSLSKKYPSAMQAQMLSRIGLLH
tara:strand:+ start:262 stop:723 length:462 start_codon:yes stop_codon:yes gene_type:complete